MDCIWCHGGDHNSDNKDKAHQGLISYPSDNNTRYCIWCHEQEHEDTRTSLHTTQEGYFERFRKRAGFDLRQDPSLRRYFNAECGKCHTSCGQCHVSRPKSAGSGLNHAHLFIKTPDLVNNCTACHGTRVGEEFTGKHDGIPPDIHYQSDMNCEACHDQSDIHGRTGDHRTYRYDDNKTAPVNCSDCHLESLTANEYHQAHWEGQSLVKLSCYVCHSQNYKNCNGCHVGGSGITGTSYLTFEIGRNYLKENRRYNDFDYITVRHVPIAPNTFKYWGVPDLENFESSEPTWKMATPHNIRRWTPQTSVSSNQNCSANCHDSSYYLTADDVELYGERNYSDETGLSGYGYNDISREIEANKNVFIP